MVSHLRSHSSRRLSARHVRRAAAAAGLSAAAPTAQIAPSSRFRASLA